MKQHSLRVNASYEGNVFSPAELRLIERFIRKDRSQEAMARVLNISVNTVQSHRKRMIEKIRGRAFSDVLLYCIEKGIVEVS